MEAQNFEIRKNVLKYDEVLNRQRQVIYAERHRVLNGEDLEDEVRIFLDDTIAGAVANATAEGYPEVGPRPVVDAVADVVPGGRLGCGAGGRGWR